MYFLAYFLYYFVTAGGFFACLYQAGELQDPQKDGGGDEQKRDGVKPFSGRFRLPAVFHISVPEQAGGGKQTEGKADKTGDGIIGGKACDSADGDQKSPDSQQIKQRLPACAVLPQKKEQDADQTDETDQDEHKSENTNSHRRNLAFFCRKIF